MKGKHKVLFGQKILFAIVTFLSMYYTLTEMIGVAITYLLQLFSLIVLLLYSADYLKNIERNSFVNSCLLFLLLFVGYSVFTEFVNDQFRSVAFATLIPLPFFMYDISPKVVRRLFWTVCATSIISLLYLLMTGRAENEFYYGDGYYALVSLPLGLYCLRNKSPLIILIWIVAMFSLTLVAAKRGDILACVVGVMLYLFHRYIQSSKGLKRNPQILILVLGIFIMYFAFEYIYQNLDILHERIVLTKEGNSSGREIIYTVLWDIFKDSSFTNMLWGYGMNAPYNFIGIQAHNDWLELLLDEGVVGGILYLSMIMSLLVCIKKKSISDDLRPLGTLIIAIWMVKSFFSMYIFSVSTVMIMMLVGYILNPNVNHDK